MDNTMKLFFAVLTGFLWTMVAGTLDASLTALFHYFSFDALDGFIHFLKYAITLIGGFAVAYFGFFLLRSAWKSRGKF
ncbi:hypothetical protein [Ectobacillus ponti]|uniref:Uncharacterized protein n=1 Tax=Ectobacillus ponti TaxID=2961894 RepID=A0AA41X8Q9_9BACI|nr:hypothetical protein [Ectobacillus ponti]MCP8970862.1 hypothetical protein [Ectobacillus ponti]